MVLRFVIFTVIGLALTWFGLLLYKSFQSQKMENLVGIVNGKLMACSEKPNCVSSFSSPEDKQHYYPPLEDYSVETLWQKVNLVVKDMKFKIITANEQYIHATHTSRIMRFVDDIEFLYSEADQRIYVRSASRVGYSDMGANRKRMDEIFKRIQEQ